jgi:hypothetical protein
MRLKQWESNLARCIASARSRKFAWSEHDCAKFVCECIQAVTGADVYSAFRGRYTDRRSMVKVIREYGAALSELASTIAQQSGLQPIPLSLARRGDVVLVNEGKFNSLAVVDGVYALGAAERGLARVPRKHWKLAWKVD